MATASPAALADANTPSAAPAATASNVQPVGPLPTGSQPVPGVVVAWIAPNSNVVQFGPLPQGISPPPGMTWGLLVPVPIASQPAPLSNVAPVLPISNTATVAPLANVAKVTPLPNVAPVLPIADVAPAAPFNTVVQVVRASDLGPVTAVGRPVPSPNVGPLAPVPPPNVAPVAAIKADTQSVRVTNVGPLASITTPSPTSGVAPLTPVEAVAPPSAGVVTAGGFDDLIELPLFGGADPLAMPTIPVPDLQPPPSEEPKPAEVLAPKAEPKPAEGVPAPKVEPKPAEVPAPKAEPKKPAPPAAIAPAPSVLLPPPAALAGTLPPPLYGEPPAVAPAAAPAKTRVYGTVDTLLWTLKRDNAPTLVTGGPPAGQGVPGRPGTVERFGGRYSSGLHTGVRGTVGGWLADDAPWAVEASLLYFVPRQRTVAFLGGPGVVLGVPFRDATPGGGSGGVLGGRVSTVGPDGARAYQIAPANGTGTASVRYGSQLWGGEANAVYALGRGGPWAVTALAGFRYLDLKERLELVTGQTGTGANAGQLATTTYDSFATWNQFYGGQFGARARGTYGRLSVSAAAKVGLGFTRQTVAVDGGYVSPAANFFGAAGAGPGGLLTAPNTNIGTHYRNKFSVVPEATATVGYDVTDRVAVSAGYDFLYWSGVARPGEQIDGAVNLNNVGPAPGASRVGPTVPAYVNRQTGFFAHGVNLGASLKY